VSSAVVRGTSGVLQVGSRGCDGRSCGFVVVRLVATGRGEGGGHVGHDGGLQNRMAAGAGGMAGQVPAAALIRNVYSQLCLEGCAETGCGCLPTSRGGTSKGETGQLVGGIVDDNGRRRSGTLRVDFSSVLALNFVTLRGKGRVAA
jgi:hypothetical protein